MPPRITAQQVFSAMGSRDGDELFVENKFAKVGIERRGARYFLTGDVDTDDSGRGLTLAEATVRALLVLGEFARGRAD
jgi:hypothetical protein